MSARYDLCFIFTPYVDLITVVSAVMLLYLVIYQWVNARKMSSIANTLELDRSGTNPSIFSWIPVFYDHKNNSNSHPFIIILSFSMCLTFCSTFASHFLCNNTSHPHNRGLQHDMWPLGPPMKTASPHWLPRKGRDGWESSRTNGTF